MAQDKFHIYTHVTLSGEGLGFSNALSIINKPYKATKKTAAELFAAMEKAGYKWNAEEKKVEKIRWRAKKGEKFWTSAYREVDGVGLFIPTELMDSGSRVFDMLCINGDYHKTKADCQKLCDQLNATVKNFVA